MPCTFFCLSFLNCFPYFFYPFLHFSFHPIFSFSTTRKPASQQSSSVVSLSSPTTAARHSDQNHALHLVIAVRPHARLRRSRASPRRHVPLLRPQTAVAIWSHARRHCGTQSTSSRWYSTSSLRYAVATHLSAVLSAHPCVLPSWAPYCQRPWLCHLR